MNEVMFPLDTRLPALLRSGKRLRGIFNGIPSPALVEMCAYAGFDFLLIDKPLATPISSTHHLPIFDRSCGITLQALSRLALTCVMTNGICGALDKDWA